jgi:hypothetical protein
VKRQFFQEGRLRFEFPADWSVLRPGEASFYKKHFQGFCGGSKETDFVLKSGDGDWYLLEVTDYTTDRRTKPLDLVEELSIKVRDTLSLLLAGAANDVTGHEGVGAFARGGGMPSKIRVVLHLEQPNKLSRMFAGVTLEANFQDKLRKSLRCVDSHPRVVSTTSPNLPWKSVWDPKASAL